ncbi:type I-E CRISPR-associated protein Cse1/CasA [Orrella sp. JC864]|uniref:type I-E CRISPR-associated protein Cse1/CasA n=1 Tax=Orrella sp. JC864 TaxID=3120298 RepID=UPI003009E172
MNLLTDHWLTVQDASGEIGRISPLDIGNARYRDLVAVRPDFRAGLYQLLIGLLQYGLAPLDMDEWRERWRQAPDAATLEAAWAPYLHAFELESEGAAFMQDLQLPLDANLLPVVDLLIDAGSDSNLYFNKMPASQGFCQACVAQALFTLQINAPSGGRGVRTSLRGGGPMTTLLLPQAEDASLWQRLWLNVLTQDALGYPEVAAASDVLPWLAPTRTSDGADALATTPETVHPLQAYWSMPRRIRLDAGTCTTGDCGVCGASGVRLFHHYRTRHGGTNYTGAWLHPLTPYTLDPKNEQPPLSIKGQPGGVGYRHWLGLALGTPDMQPAAAQVVSHFHAKIGLPGVRLWCFGYDVANMKARCWYESSLPVHVVEEASQAALVHRVKEMIAVAVEAASALHKHVKAAWFKRPGDVGSEPAIFQSFWEGSEHAFYAAIAELVAADVHDEAAIAPLYRSWLLAVRGTATALFEQWTLAGPIEERDLGQVVKARAGLNKDLSAGKSAKQMWKTVTTHLKEKA